MDSLLVSSPLSLSWPLLGAVMFRKLSMKSSNTRIASFKELFFLPSISLSFETESFAKFLSTFKVDVQVDDGGDDDADAGDEEDVDDFVDTDSNCAVAVASASNDDDDIEEDGDGDSESKDNGDDDDDCK